MILLILYFASPLPLIASFFFSNIQKYSDPFNMLYMVLGSSAFTWIALEFLLIARPKFLEKHFGLDRFYRFHGIMAFVALALAFIHRMLLDEAWDGTQTALFGNIAFFAFLALTLITVLFMAETSLMKVKPLQKLKRTVHKSKAVNRERLKVVHNLNAIVLVVLLIHLLSTSAVRTSFSSLLITVLTFSLAATAYLYHKIAKKRMSSFVPHVVSEVIRESEKVWTLRFKPVEGPVMDYKPGQFGFIKIFSPHIQQEEHPFSISSNPADKRFLSVTVKEVGDFTSNIGKVKPGDPIHFDGPYGKFSYVHHKDEDVVFLIAGGVGITPLISMLRHMSKTQPKKKVVLLWGLRNRAELAFQEELKDITRRMDNFILIPIMSADAEWGGETGFVNREKIERAAARSGSDLQANGYYICGPGIMMDSVIAVLRSKGVSDSRIHFERFAL